MERMAGSMFELQKSGTIAANLALISGRNAPHFHSGLSLLLVR